MFQAVRKMIGLQRQPTIQVSLAPFTPDEHILEQYYFQNVFIYSELMKGCAKFTDLMDGSVVRLAAAFTKEDNYVLWQNNMGRESQVFALPMGPEQIMGNTTLFGAPAKVLGHLYTMRYDQIKKLDEHLQNGVQFVRKRIKIEVPFSYKTNSQHDPITAKANTPETRIVTLPAWAYIGNLSYWAEMIEPNGKRFSPVRKYNSGESGEPYYYYAEKVERKFG